MIIPGKAHEVLSDIINTYHFNKSQLSNLTGLHASTIDRVQEGLRVSFKTEMAFLILYINLFNAKTEQSHYTRKLS